MIRCNHNIQSLLSSKEGNLSTRKIEHDIGSIKRRTAWENVLLRESDKLRPSGIFAIKKAFGRGALYCHYPIIRDGKLIA